MSIADCRDVEIADVEARSGSGMGIVAEMCENIRILRYKVLPDEGSTVSVTADMIFLVDTKGHTMPADASPERRYPVFVGFRGPRKSRPA